MNEDAIDRKLVCAFIDGLISDDGERKKGLEYIRNMPPVNPAKTGHWMPVKGYEGILWECSECHNKRHHTTIKWNYCPDCGTKTVKPQESDN